MNKEKHTKFKESLFIELVDLEDVSEQVITEQLNDIIKDHNIDKSNPEVKTTVDFAIESYISGVNSATDLASLLDIPITFSDEKRFMVWYMKVKQNRTYREIAGLLKVTESTIRDHYRNAERRFERMSETVKEYLKLKGWDNK